MSNTESFEQALEAATPILLDECAYIGDCTEEDDCKQCGRLMAARLKRAHDREIRDTAQQEYDRGYNAGQHSMDAEHRAVAMRLRQLPLDGGSVENVFNIARAVYHNDFGWAANDCAALRDELVRLMGGVSKPSAADVAKELMDTIIEEGNRRLASESIQQSYKNGDSCETEGDDDTCDSQCRGACAAGDGGDSGEHAEVSDGGPENVCAGDVSRSSFNGRDCLCHNTDCGVSQATEVGDGRTGDSCIRRHPRRGAGWNDMCVGRDSGEHSRGQEVEHGGAAHDCADDFRGGSGSDVVHMDGVTYDVLDNERHKAVCELRGISVDELCKKYDYIDVYPEFIWSIGQAIGMRYGAGFEEIIQRLIHLLGGDQPSGIDVLREMDGESDVVGTCPNDVLTSTITDELRECVDTATKTYDDTPWHEMDGDSDADHTICYVTEGELLRIADRIDAQFDRICAQQEAVLQETIDSMCEERDRLQERLRTAELGCDANHRLAEANARWCDELLDLLRDARDEYKTLDQVSAVTSANFHAMRDRAWGLEAERDELRRKVDAIRDALDG